MKLTKRPTESVCAHWAGVVIGSMLAFGCSGEGGSSAAGNSTSERDSGSGSGRTPTPQGGTGTGGSEAGAGDASPGNHELGDSTVSVDGSIMKATIFARDVAPGQEEHICVVVHLPNDEPVQVNEVRATLTEGSHHLIVDRRPADAPEQRVPERCPPTQGDSTRLIIGQQKDTRITLPEPAAYSLEANQPVFLQLHYINTTSETRDIVGTAELTMADESADLVEVESLFTGSFSIEIPPQSPGVSESFMVPESESGTRHVFALTSHTHSLGVRATIERVGSADAPPVEPIHESLDWAEPPLTVFDTPLEFDGSDGLRLRCEYENDTDRTVHFGTEFEDEMCFMWMYYYDL